MTIEFHCPHCDKLLKTPDDKAGIRANCPGCGQAVTVPESGLEAAHTDASFDAGGASQTGFETAESDAESSSVEDTKPCPMCGASIKKAAIRCRHCGETFVQRRMTGNWEPSRINVGDVLNVAWETYKSQFGILIGAFAIWAGIYIGMSIFNQVVFQVMALAIVGLGGNGGGNAVVAVVAMLVAVFVLTFALVGILMYLEAGMTLLLLRVARGENVEIADLFRGGRFFWRFIGVALLFGGAIFIAYILVIIPGIALQDPTWSAVAAIPFFLISIFVSLRFWPVGQVIVDRDAGVFEALRDSLRATQGNSLNVFVLALAAFGVYLMGVLACFIGVIFAIPFIRLMFCVAYCAMTGQLAMRREE